MFDDNYGVSLLHQAIEHVDERTNVLEMQSGSGFIENIHRAAGVTLGEFGSQLHSLAFAARECGARLAEFQITESHVLQHFDFVQDIGHVFKKLHRAVDCHVQYVGDALPFETHLKCLAVIAFAVAGFARHVHIGQEIHLDGFVATAFAGFAAPATHIE